MCIYVYVYMYVCLSMYVYMYIGNIFVCLCVYNDNV